MVGLFLFLRGKSLVTVDKKTLEFLTLRFIAGIPENTPQYDQVSDILLTLTGVSDGEGNLSKEYAESPFWEGGQDGTPLRPSSKADIAAKLPRAMWYLLGSDPKQSNK